MVYVADPFARKRNIARSVSHSHVFEYIYDRIRAAFSYFGIPQTIDGPLILEVDDKKLEGQLRENLKKLNESPHPPFDKSVDETGAEDQDAEKELPTESDLEKSKSQAALEKVPETILSETVPRERLEEAGTDTLDHDPEKCVSDTKETEETTHIDCKEVDPCVDVLEKAQDSESECGEGVGEPEPSEDHTTMYLNSLSKSVWSSAMAELGVNTEVNRKIVTGLASVSKDLSKVLSELADHPADGIDSGMEEPLESAEPEKDSEDEQTLEKYETEMTTETLEIEVKNDVGAELVSAEEIKPKGDTQVVDIDDVKLGEADSKKEENGHSEKEIDTQDEEEEFEDAKEEFDESAAKDADREEDLTSHDSETSEAVPGIPKGGINLFDATLFERVKAADLVFHFTEETLSDGKVIFILISP